MSDITDREIAKTLNTQLELVRSETDRICAAITKDLTATEGLEAVLSAVGWLKLARQSGLFGRQLQSTGFHWSDTDLTGDNLIRAKNLIAYEDDLVRACEDLVYAFAYEQKLDVNNLDSVDAVATNMWRLTRIRTDESQRAEGEKPKLVKRSKRIPLAEANILVRDWLAKHAKDNPTGITRDAVAKGTGVSPASVSRTAAWQAFRKQHAVGEGCDWDARPIKLHTMKARRPKPPDYEANPPDLSDSPLYWLAVLSAARKSKDRLLEWHARRHLTRLGVRVIFDDSPPPKGGRDHV